MGGREGKGGEDRGREGIERNVAFHHLLLNNLTTEFTVWPTGKKALTDTAMWLQAGW